MRLGWPSRCITCPRGRASGTRSSTGCSRSSARTGEQRLWRATPLASNASGEQRLWRATPLASNASGEQRLWRATPLASNASGEQRLWRATPLASNASGEQRLWRATPLASNASGERSGDRRPDRGDHDQDRPERALRARPASLSEGGGCVRCRNCRAQHRARRVPWRVELYHLVPPSLILTGSRSCTHFLTGPHTNAGPLVVERPP